MADTLPKYLYKIIPNEPPASLPTEWPISDLDQKDGFIHLSKSTQVPNTCNLFFASFSTIWVLKLESSKFASGIKTEDGFPHLYGNFGANDIAASQKFERAEGHKWSESMAGSSFLE